MNLSEIKQFSFSSDNIAKFSILKINQQVKKVSNIKKKLNESLFIPKYKDSLFWCYYILIYGIDSLQLIKSDFQEEKSIKINLIQIIRENKASLKEKKIKKVNIEDELLNQSKISPQTFIFLCFLKQKNIIIKRGKVYVEVINNIDDPTIHFIEKNEKKYGLQLLNVQKHIDLCRANNLKVDNIHKPIRALSFYKLKQLQDICLKLNIEITKKLRKKDLYEMINLKIDIK